jgi:orotidine-5'-phosphate decarboxylase
MKAIEKLKKAQERLNTSLCVGIDPDFNKIPSIFPKSAKGIEEFSLKIIDATKDFASAYKINFAFFEYFGSKGLEALENIFNNIPDNIFTIADAKRSDIGNSSQFYAKAIFNHFNFDSVTVNPLMGKDSLVSFFEFTDKMIFLLGITSNSGADDFLKLYFNDKHLFEIIIEKSQLWFEQDNLGFVVGATQINEFKTARQLAPNNYFLIPGIGSQGGDFNKLKKYKLTPSIINVSRDILFASSQIDFAEKANKKAEEYFNLFSLF